MRKIALLALGILSLGGCFSASGGALKDVLNKSANVCPIANVKPYNLYNKNGLLGQVTISQKIIGNEKICFLSGATNLSPELGFNLANFFSKSFHKMPNNTHMLYDKKIGDNNELVFLAKAGETGYLIYTSCKIGKDDCPKATTANEIISLANALSNQTPTYRLEIAK